MVAHSGTPAGLLLTGGASRRLGRDKALVVIDGVTLADRAAALLVAVCDPVIEVGPGRTGLPVVLEDPPGSGPLAALVAGWAELGRRGHPGPVLVLAVDMPGVTAALLRHLATRPGPATAVPVDRRLPEGGQTRPQPLCARYGADALDTAADLVAAGERSLRSLLAVTPVVWVEAGEWEPLAGSGAFADVDTPGDLEAFGDRVDPGGRSGGSPPS
jgi:molybdopterin-guanine dinucleotide biosynthesis protein A